MSSPSYRDCVGPGLAPAIVLERRPMIVAVSTGVRVAALMIVTVSAHAKAPAPRPPAAAESRGERSAVSVDDFAARTYEDGKGHRLPYRLFAPRADNEVKGTKRKYPLVVFFHGSGGRGNDNRGQLIDQDAALVFVKSENQARWPVFMLAPQCPIDQQWVDMPWAAATGKGKQPKNSSWPLAAALALVDELLRADSRIDPARIHVTGMSMGGFATWDAAVRQPSRWKTAVVVCGGYDELAVAPLVSAHLPLWAFHAADDLVVPVSRSREMVAALRARGATPRYTEYPAAAGYGHFSWRPAYSDPELLPWMFGPPAAR